jgi:cytochrome c-type biogenesis protein CcmH/NrfG
MENALTSEFAASEFLRAKQVYFMAAICLLLGLGIGYGLRGVQGSTSPSVPAAASAPAAKRMPTLDEMKHMADIKAAPLLAKLKSNPHDSALLVEVGAIYHGTHQFKEAASYYGRAVESDPKNVALRASLASSLYRSGDVDGALAQLKEGLRYEPGDANSLFNLGMILLQGKGDGKGALAAWQRLLKSNPQLSADRKAEVQKLMADVMTTLASQHAAKGAAGK